MKQAGYKNKEIASRFGVSVRTIQRIKLSFPLESGTKKKVKRPRTTVAQRTVALALLEEGYSQAEVAKRTNMSQGSVSNAKRRFEDTGSHENRRSAGWPRISTKRDDRVLERQSLKNRFMPATRLRQQWKQTGVDASISTVRRCLCEANLMGRVARQKPMLTRTHMRRRLDFAKKYKHWTKKIGSKFSGRMNHHLAFLESAARRIFEDAQERNSTLNV